MAGNPTIVVEYLADTKGFADGVKSMRRGFKLAGAAAVAGLGVAVVATKELVDQASDLSESVNAVNTVFGKASKTVLDFSKKAATEAGLSMKEFNELVTPLGASLRNTGLGAEEAAKQSVELTKRAADMASVFNTDVPTALEAIQAGLRGEADPLEKFGVGLSDAAIQAEALRQGMKKSHGQLTAHQKTTARLAILYRQTNRLAGDFKDTSDGLANAQRIVHAEFQNIEAQLGTALLPVVAKVASGFGKFLAKISEAKGVGAKFQVVLNTVKTLAQRLFETLRDAIGRIDWAGIWAQARGLAQGLQDALARVNWSAIGKTIGASIATAVALAAPRIKEAFSKVLAVARQVDWVKLGKAMGPGLAAAIAVAFVTLTDVSFWVKNWDLALAVAAVAFTRGLGRFGTALAAPLRRAGSNIMLRILAGIEEASPRLAAGLLAALTKLPGVVRSALALLSAPVKAAMARLGALARFTVTVLGIQAAINAVAGLVQKVGAWFKRLPGVIASAGAGAVTAAYDLGTNIVLGLINGMAAMGPALFEKAKSLVKGALDSAARFLHVKSPSRLWAQLGVDTIRGYILGIDQSLPTLKGKSAEAMQVALDAARQRVEASQGRFRAAFERLADFAGRAFEGRTQQLLAGINRQFDQATPAEAALTAIQQQEAERQRQTELAEAQAAVAAAATADERVAAAERLRQARLAITVAGLEQQATVERAAREAQRATAIQEAEEQRRQQGLALDQQLEQLREKLAEHPKARKKVHQQIMALLGRFGIDYKQAGEDAGEQFAKGLKASEKQVEKAASSLAKVVAKYLPHSPAEKGPLARTDFFRGFGAMLAANMMRGAGALERAAGGLAGAATAGLTPGLVGAAGGGPVSVRVFIGERELTGIVRTEVESQDQRTAQVLLAGRRY